MGIRRMHDHTWRTSALSPVLFNVFTVGITSNQLEGPGRTLSFADDGLAYRTRKDRQVIGLEHGVKQIKRATIGQ